MIKLSGISLSFENYELIPEKFFKICFTLKNSSKLKDMLTSDDLEDLYYYIDTLFRLKDIKETLLIDIELYDTIVETYNKLKKDINA